MTCLEKAYLKAGYMIPSDCNRRLPITMTPGNVCPAGRAAGTLSEQA